MTPVILRAKKMTKTGVMAHGCNPNTQEPWVGKSNLRPAWATFSDILSQNKV